MIRPFKSQKISETRKIRKYAVLIFGIASGLFVSAVFVYGLADKDIREKLLLFFVIFIPVVFIIFLVSVLIDYWKVKKPK